MRTITFKTIRIKNFMSFGDDEFTLDFSNGLNLITGYNRDIPDLKNGIGKCLDPQTEIEISIDDKMVKEKFKNFVEKYKTDTKYLYEEHNEEEKEWNELGIVGDQNKPRHRK